MSGSPSSDPSAGPSVFSAAKSLAIAKFATQILSWVGTYYVATVLMPKDYGLSAMATAFTQFAQLFAEMGIGVTIIQRQNMPEKEVHNLFSFSLMLGAFCAVASFFLAYAGGWYFRRTDIIPLTQFTAVVFLANALSIVPYNILNRDMRFRERGWVDMYSTFVSVAAQVTMAHAGWGAWSLILGVGIRAVVRTAASFWYSKYVPSLQFNWGLVKRDLVFSLPVTFNGLLYVLKEKSIPLILGRFFSATQLGYYALANTLSDIPNQKVVQIVREILLPMLSRRDQSGRVDGFFTALKFCTLFIVPVYIAGFYYGAPILEAIFPAKWGAMAEIFAGLCLVQIFIVFISIGTIYATAGGRPILSTYAEVSLALLIPGATFAFHMLPLNTLPYVWAVVHLVVFAVWIFALMRGAGNFLWRLLGLNLQVAGVCVAVVAADYALFRFAHLDRFGHAQVLAFVRAGAYLVAYSGFVYLFHREFLLGLRKK
ncbi:MAG: oligosaccharide flippase family protein [Fibrobacteria bacterium]